MMLSHTIHVSSDVYQRLERLAKSRKQSIDAYADQALQAAMPNLPSDIEYELSTLAQLPDDLLLLVVSNAWASQQAERLAWLNSKMDIEGDLLEQEAVEQASLVEAYRRGVLRRTQAIELLRRRGYELSGLL